MRSELYGAGGTQGLALPRVLRIRQHVETSRIADVPARASALLREAGLRRGLHRDDRVAIGVGSRGIADLTALVLAVVAEVRCAGAQPFIVPFMGSHGSATADGQAQVLADLGVSEASMGAPVLSSMEAVEVGRSRFGSPVWASTDLLSMDAVVVINRVKPHTDFTGSIESGIAKMLVIGVGKHRGAIEAHRLFVRHGFAPVIEEYTGCLLARLPVLWGLAIIENQLDETAELHALAAAEILAREPALLRRARELMPALPFSRLDCLVIDEMGKDVSGSGMDTNVIGRKPGADGETAGPDIRRIFVRDLTPASEGNAIGIGMADFTTTRLLASVDRDATAINALTAMAPEVARLPLAFDSDVEALGAAYATSGAASPAAFRVAWIRNTLSLEEILISEALAGDVADSAGLEVLGDSFPFPVDPAGGLAPDWWSERSAHAT
jgi:hypothetical protein